jgi:hypothetical protein
MTQLTKRSLFRVVYRVDEDPTPLKEQITWSGFGRRKTVVADDLQEAIDKVREHEQTECPKIVLHITEVVREQIEVWA